MEFLEDNRLYICEHAFEILVRAIVSVRRDLDSGRIQFLSVGALHHNSNSGQCVSDLSEGTMSSTGTTGFIREGFVRRSAPASQANRPLLVTEEYRVQSEKFRLKDEDYEKIVCYLEIPENFAAVHGSGRRTKVGQKYQSKATVMKSMLAALIHHGFPKQITAPNLTKRFQRYKLRYKQAREVKTGTGAGLTEEEFAAGMTLEDKLNRLCPHFERMHALYGGRPNVSPPITGDVGVESEDFVMAEEESGEVEILDEWENMSPNIPQQYSPTIILDGNPHFPNSLHGIFGLPDYRISGFP